MILEHKPYHVHHCGSEKGLTDCLNIFGYLQAAAERIELFLIFLDGGAVICRETGISVREDARSAGDEDD